MYVLEVELKDVRLDLEVFRFEQGREVGDVCPIAEWSGTRRSYVLTVRQDYTTINTFIETL